MKAKSLLCSIPALFLSLPIAASTPAAQYGYMQQDLSQLARWRADLSNLPVYQAPAGYPASSGAVNLAEHMPIVAADRDQGHSGTCWNWGCQGVMSIDYAVQHPDEPLMTNGFSVQLLNSYLQLVDFMMAPGGSPLKFANFYNGLKFAIPWSNTNAYWRDGNIWNMAPAATIYTQPNMPLESVEVSTVLTFTNSAATAIANLKSALDAGHALWFNMTLANDDDWSTFCTFWGKTNANEDTVIDLAFGANHEYDQNNGGSHLVACVGYDDRDPDPAKHCWLMLNSWGDGGQGDDGMRRPNGMFRMAMHTQYDARLRASDTNDVIQMFEWGLLETTWANKVRKPVGGLSFNMPLRNSAASSVTLTNVSFPRSSLMTNVASAFVQVNWEDFSCSQEHGTWSVAPGGFHYDPNPGERLGVVMDINTNTCTWSLTATNFPADYARKIDPYRGLRIEGSCTQVKGSADNFALGTFLFAFDELEHTSTGGFTSPPPATPSLSLRLNGSHGVLRIAGETGRTCAVQETSALGGLWSVRALVPMTQPVEEVALPAPLDTNRFWRVKVQ